MELINELMYRFMPDTTAVEVQTGFAEEPKNEVKETPCEEEKNEALQMAYEAALKATPVQCLGCQFDILPVELTNAMPWVCECCGLRICASCRYSEPHCISVKCGLLQKRQ